jgi:hypothetical protein
VRASVDHAVKWGTFSLDGQTFDVENHVWVVGDVTECVVLDAPHDVPTILEVVGPRQVRAIIATHGHGPGPLTDLWQGPCRRDAL